MSLAPGERFEGELSLRDACEFWGPGRFTVRFWTTVAVHVDKGGEAFSDYCPIRIPVSGEARFDVAQDK